MNAVTALPVAKTLESPHDSLEWTDNHNDLRPLCNEMINATSNLVAAVLLEAAIRRRHVSLQRWCRNDDLFVHFDRVHSIAVRDRVVSPTQSTVYLTERRNRDKKIALSAYFCSPWPEASPSLMTSSLLYRQCYARGPDRRGY